jgi:hypothetical protein
MLNFAHSGGEIMKPARPQNNQPRLKIRLVVMGAEGEGIESEIFHYLKHLRMALETYGGLIPSVVANENKFRKIWRTKCIGVGDEAVYKIFRALAKRKNIIFPSWKMYEKEINSYYRKHLSEAEIINGFDDTKAMVNHNGVWVMLATHAPPPLLDDQLKQIKDKTDPPVIFEKWQIVQGKRKDGDKESNAYIEALNRANKKIKEENKKRIKENEELKKENKKLLPLIEPIEPENVLVLDASPKYLAKASGFGMYTATIASKREDYLMPEKEELIELPRYLGLLDWVDISRFIVKGPVQQPDGPNASPR